LINKASLEFKDLWYEFGLDAFEEAKGATADLVFRVAQLFEDATKLALLHTGFLA